MFGNRMRIRGGWLASGGSLLLAGLVACANATAAPGPESTEGPKALSAVRVSSEGEATRVDLEGPAAPSYTAFRRDEPAGLVVELAEVAPGEVESPIAVYDGTVQEITVAERESGGTRLEIGLAGEADYDVTPGESGLELRLTPQHGPAAAEGSGAKDPWARAGEGRPAEDEAGESASSETAARSDSADSADSADAAAASEEELAEEEEEAPAATALLGVAVPEGEPAHIELETDGRVGSMSRFVLDDPHRLVVDLPGLENRVRDARIEVGRGDVARVRIGQHPEKVRVVVDATSEDAALGGARLVRSDAGLRVALRKGTAGSGAEAPETRTAAQGTPASGEEPGASEPEPEPEAEAEAEPAPGEPASPATMASALEPEERAAETAATEEGAGAAPAGEGSGTVYGVQFDGQAERDRVVVLTGGEPAYEVAEVDPETVMVRLLDATIDPGASVRVAPDGPGPVGLVTAFQQPETETPEVRVVIRRAAGLEPEIERKGGFLFVDFPRSGQAAAAVPALRGGEGETGTSPAAGAEGAPSTASRKAAARASAEAAPAAPAAVQRMDDPIEVLEEGGLVEGKEYTGRRISLDFKDVEIDDVLRLIAEVSSLNIIAGDDVQGKVTIRLVDVPWDQALDVILLTKGLGFTRVGNVLRIAPADVLQKEKEARLQEKRSQEKLEDLVVKLQPVNYANAGQVKSLVQRLLTERGSVDVDKRTNTVILKDIPSVIDEATALIKAVDTQTPQVLIEARIVEASLDFSRSLGSSFSFGTQPFTDPVNGTGGNRTDIDFGDDVLFDPTANNVSVSNPIGASNGLLNLGAFLIDERFSLDVTLQAAETNEEVKIVSSPRVVTLDNQTATIESGQEIPFQSGISDGGATQLQFEEAKTKLEVTPHITPDKSIVMEVTVEKSSVSESVESSTGDPAIDTNEAKAKTLVKDGQTLVIGGLQTTSNQENESRVPFFHRIPILGNAFKSQRTVDARNELLIFVTPRIVTSTELGT